MSERGMRFLPALDAEVQWKQFEQRVRAEADGFFDGEGPIVGARAPGRLDVMGGVADYSGSIVLEMPIGEAACAAWQWRNDHTIRVRSLGIEQDGLTSEAVFSLDDLVTPDGRIRPVEEVRRCLTADPPTRWAAYVVGCYYVMLAAYSKVSQGKTDERFGELGANILLQSSVPLGAGVSSSAAIEVATMHALSEAAGIHPSDLTLAAWCQRVENSLVGAPCGIMDQVTSALGKQNGLTVLRCQPHDLLGTQQVPAGWRFVGLDSRVKHSVGGSHYTKARIGAFMGLKIVQLESGKFRSPYLCNLKPAEFAAFYALIPETLTGADFHTLYGQLPDTVTRVDEAETYRPRDCATHPVLENDRVLQFFGLMQVALLRQEETGELAERDGRPVTRPEPDRNLMRSAGELMYESHASYSDRIDLGSPETDLLVQLVRERGPERGLYGAKITGGGSGGTVAVLLEDTPEAEIALAEVCDAYQERIGHAPRPIVGSSPGAVMFGARYIERG